MTCGTFGFHLPLMFQLGWSSMSGLTSYLLLPSFLNISAEILYPGVPIVFPYPLCLV